MYGEKKLRKKNTEFEFSSHNVKDGTASNPFDTVARTFDKDHSRGRLSDGSI
jgi:hypothetical protein